MGHHSYPGLSDLSAAGANASNNNTLLDSIRELGGALPDVSGDLSGASAGIITHLYYPVTTTFTATSIVTTADASAMTASAVATLLIVSATAASSTL
jgi:hypothetical protein